MKLLVQIALLERSFNFGSATQFDAGGRAAQTSRLVHVSSLRLQRRHAAYCIEQNRFFDESEYNTQPATKLPKTVSLGFLVFL